MALTKINNNTLSAITGLPAGVGGKVLQVQQQVITASTSTSSTSFVDTGFSIAITPTSTSSKILCIVNLQSVSKDSSINSGMSVRIVRGSTDIGITTNMMYLGWTVSGYITASLSKLDSPSTTDATTYKVTFKNRESNPLRFNSYNGDTSTFTLYEIAS